MKKNSCGAFFALLLALCCLSCQPQDAVAPELSASQTQKVMLGKWKVQQVTYQLCRNGNCNTTNYRGTASDYFEFRADSAFLYRQEAGSRQPEAFKVQYDLPGAFILTHAFWSAKYTIKEKKDNNMVLVSSFTGNDPYAVFTDTYYLHQ